MDNMQQHVAGCEGFTNLFVTVQLRPTGQKNYN